MAGIFVLTLPGNGFAGSFEGLTHLFYPVLTAPMQQRLLCGVEVDYPFIICHSLDPVLHVARMFIRYFSTPAWPAQLQNSQRVQSVYLLPRALMVAKNSSRV